MKKFLIPLIASAALISCQSDEASPAAEKENTPSEPSAGQEADDPKNTGSYIGLTIEAAQERADKASIPNRIIEVDGEPRPATRDYRPERLNFSVKDGKVIQAVNG